MMPTAQAQKSRPDAAKWVEKMSTRNAPAGIDSLNSLLMQHPDRLGFVQSLEKKGKGSYFRARYYCLIYFATYYNAVESFYSGVPEILIQEPLKSKLSGMLDQAAQEAYLTGDERLIAEISIFCGKAYHHIKDVESAMFYLMSGLELNEKLQIANQRGDYTELGELLYKIKEYPASVSYSIKALTAPWNPGVPKDTGFLMFTNNTTALAYHRQQRYDSAFYYYGQALQYADWLKLDLWKGIVKGNMGQLYYALKQYDTAYAYLLYDYQMSKQEELYENAANSLQWAARVLLAQGNSSQAVQHVREAMALLNIRHDPAYQRNTYYAASEVFKTMGAYDSALHYNKKYELLNDSLERVAANSSIRMSKIKAANEKNRYNIQLLQQQREKQLLQRNILIAAIMLLTALTLLLLNRQQLKSRMKMERLEQERRQIQQEMQAAQQELSLITQHIVEKTALIEKLEQQINHSALTAGQQDLMTELSRQTILTDEDWDRFKSLFQKIYPDFFSHLRQKAPGITLAEQRLAALTRLQLTTRQMASMLGISVDSVHKSRQRLRNRFQITTEVNLEEYIAQI